MLPEVKAGLLELNRRFYESFGPAFAATRRRLQPGVRRVLDALPAAGNWLDLGCGGGALAKEWLRRGFAGHYLGIDFSQSLLAEAQAAVADMDPGGRVTFMQADLGDAGWVAQLPAQHFAGVFAFAVLHHIPGQEARRVLLQQVSSLLPGGGVFIHSEWQFQHSPRLWARRLEWETVGLSAADLDEGDTLLDWRFALPGQTEQTGLRYVHLFSREELAALASTTGFRIAGEFESDGEGGRLGLYQKWQKDQT